LCRILEGAYAILLASIAIIADHLRHPAAEPYLTRVLVTYATKFGSTREVVSSIVHELISAGLDAHGAEASGQLRVDDYDAFVIGSPMYGATWIPEAAVFAAAVADRINGKPVALFSVGTLGVRNPNAAVAEHEAFVDRLLKVAPKLNVVGNAAFNGSFKRSNLPWYLRIADRFAPTPEGDDRDWAAIQAWTRSLVPEFS
jgi:menaquinone-dependent protoporphyrinogen oxidase